MERHLCFLTRRQNLFDMPVKVLKDVELFRHKDDLQFPRRYRIKRIYKEVSLWECLMNGEIPLFDTPS